MGRIICVEQAVKHESAQRLPVTSVPRKEGLYGHEATEIAEILEARPPIVEDLQLPPLGTVSMPVVNARTRHRQQRPGTFCSSGPICSRWALGNPRHRLTPGHASGNARRRAGPMQFRWGVRRTWTAGARQNAPRFGVIQAPADPSIRLPPPFPLRKANTCQVTSGVGASHSARPKKKRASGGGERDPAIGWSQNGFQRPESAGRGAPADGET